jgi:CMP-N-acetylneuraminic acid synthetase
MRVLGLVPARGGSRGVPRKNLRPLAGKPLLQWTAESALAARQLARVVLSTEDPEIAAAGRSCGLEVPFARPAELAADDTPTLLVVRHALLALEAGGDRFDAVCLLQPTSPLRRAEDIDACVDLLVASGADAVVSVRPIPTEHHPRWAYLVDGDGFLRLASGEAEPPARRQELEPAYHRDGMVYVTRRDVVLRGSLYGARVAPYRVAAARPALNIDTAADWERAEALIGSDR